MARKPGYSALSDLFQDDASEQELVKTSGEDSKYRKVAKLLILIGGDEAAKVLSKLNVKQAEIVSKEIASIKGVTQAEAEELLAEFQSFMTVSSGGYKGSFSGGVDEARNLLYAAYGPEKGEAMLRKIAPDAVESPFGFLEDFTAEQLGILFKDESAASEALALSRLPAKLAADVIKNEEPAKKIEIIKRIAKMNKVAPFVLEQAAVALKEKARRIGRTDSEQIDGMNALAEILKASNVSFESRLLGELDGDDPSLGYNLRARLYTLDDILRMNDLALEEKLRTMSEKEIVFLLKGRRQVFIDKILSNVSTPRRALIREEAEILGTVPRFETDVVASDFLNWFRRGREKGEILLADDEDIIL
ncbi:MAG: flagellar motor switch protein FliG [Treponema sp.]|jgi:flagellar motor switch protein FliG|nr:flagellar motor switch protein FliG [Treponema sp.]